MIIFCSIFKKGRHVFQLLPFHFTVTKIRFFYKQNFWLFSIIVKLNEEKVPIKHLPPDYVYFISNVVMIPSCGTPVK